MARKNKELSLIFAILQKEKHYISKEWSHIYFPEKDFNKITKNGFKVERIQFFKKKILDLT